MPDVLGVFRDVGALPASFDVGALAAMRGPVGVLLCPPDHFDVIDVKNAHMAAAVGTVDTTLARTQWEALADAFRAAGMRVETIDPLDGCEDMVFTANQTFTGRDPAGSPVCLLSHMHHASRRREVPAFAAWFRAAKYRVEEPFPADVDCEGGGDLLWHPGRRLVWAGHGYRTGPAAHAVVADALRVPVLSLALRDERFYHLDTCLCPLDEHTALIVAAAFDDTGRALIERGFERVIEVDDGEAVSALACNAAVFEGGIVIDQRAVRTIARLRDLGRRVLPVDTGEYLKSGGSVFCMKQLLFERVARGPRRAISA